MNDASLSFRFLGHSFLATSLNNCRNLAIYIWHFYKFYQFIKQEIKNQ